MDQVPSQRAAIDNLLEVMRRLRDPETGCPWDLQQSPQTIINYSIEEVYELAEVVEQQPLDYAAFKDELGDVLLQVVFMAQFAAEQGEFEFADVAEQICQKMLRRHPHVFPNASLDGCLHDGAVDATASSPVQGSMQDSVQSVRENWEAIKQQEQPERAKDLFGSVPLQLPALSRAYKLQKKACKLGLDWPDALQALSKIEEETAELKALLQREVPLDSLTSQALDSAAAASDPAHIDPAAADLIAEELGDLLFSVVNVARKLGREPEQLLRRANDKFVRRARYVEKALAEADVVAEGGQDPAATTLSSADYAKQIDRLWRAAKAEERP